MHFLTMNYDGGIVLVTFNGFRFDGPVLAHNLQEAGVPIPDFKVADAQPVFTKRFENRK